MVAKTSDDGETLQVWISWPIGAPVPDQFTVHLREDDGTDWESRGGRSLGDMSGQSIVMYTFERPRSI